MTSPGTHGDALMPRPTSLRRAAAALVAAGAAISPWGVRAEMIDIVWDGAGRFSHSLRLPPGKFVELCQKLPAGASVQWSYEAQGPLNFNVHYHEGKQVHTPARQDGAARGEGVLKAAVAQDYCWMWTNKSASEASLTLRLKKE